MTICIEGKWKNIRRIVSALIEDGWTALSIHPNETFTFTIVELRR